MSISRKRAGYAHAVGIEATIEATHAGRASGADLQTFYLLNKPGATQALWMRERTRLVSSR